MTTQITVKNNEIEFKNANSSQDGSLSLTDDGNMLSSRLFQFGNGLTSTTMTIGTNGSVIATSDFGVLTTENLKIRNAGEEYITIKTPSGLSAEYTLVLPTAQGAANTVLQNDGSGNLSFAALSSSLAGLSDTSSTTPGTNSLLQYDGSEFVYNTSISGLTLVSSSTLTASGTVNAGTISCTGNAQAINLTATSTVQGATITGTTSISTSTINEYSSGSGVNVDSVLCKDSTVKLTNGSGSTTIGQRSGGSSALTINFPNTAPVAGQYLASADTSGNLGWATLSIAPRMTHFPFDLQNSVSIGTSLTPTTISNRSVNVPNGLGAYSTSVSDGTITVSAGVYRILIKALVAVESSTTGSHCATFRVHTTFSNTGWQTNTKKMVSGALGSNYTTVTTPTRSSGTGWMYGTVLHDMYVHASGSATINYYVPNYGFTTATSGTFNVGDNSNAQASSAESADSSFVRIFRYQ